MAGYIAFAILFARLFLTVDPSSDIQRNGYIAASYCKDFVSGRLKSPSSASFPFLPNSTSHVGDGVYEVHSYVDAQNSYGAVIRTSYTCRVRPNGKPSEGWSLVSLEFSK